MNKEQLLTELKNYSEEGSELVKKASEETKKNRTAEIVRIIFLCLISFLVPLFGLVYGCFLVNKHDRKNKISGFTYIGFAAVSVLVQSFVYRYILNKYL